MYYFLHFLKTSSIPSCCCLPYTITGSRLIPTRLQMFFCMRRFKHFIWLEELGSFFDSDAASPYLPLPCRVLYKLCSGV